MIYILHGKDSFRKQLCLNNLKSQFIEPGMEALGYVQVHNPSLIEFSTAVQTPAFGLGNKVILIKDLKYLENKADDSEVETIMQALSNLPENIILIFDSGKITGTIKLVKQIKSKLKDIVEIQEFKPFNPWDVKQAATWLVSSQAEVKLDQNTAEYLVEHIGAEDSSKLHSELSRLAILGKPITTELINQECRSKHDIFKFIRELAYGNIAKANHELEKIINNKEAHLGLVSVMQTTLAKYLKLKHAEQERRSQDQQASILGISPQRLYYQKKEVANMNSSRLQGLLNITLDSERKIKTGAMPIERALRVLVNSSSN